MLVQKISNDTLEERLKEMCQMKSELEVEQTTLEFQIKKLTKNFGKAKYI